MLNVWSSLFLRLALVTSRGQKNGARWRVHHHFSSTLCKRVIIKTYSATNGNLKEKKLEKSESCHAWLERRKFGVNLTDLFDGDCSENIECLTIKKQIFVDK